MNRKFLLKNENTARRGLLNRNLHALIVFLIISPCLGSLWFVHEFAHDFPFWDEWDACIPSIYAAKTGTLTLGIIAKSHNGHMIAFPRLISIANAYITGWNRKAEIYLNVVFYCLGLWFLYLIVRGLPRSAHLAWFIPIAWILLGWHQWENFVMGMETAFGLVTCMGLLTMLCLCRAAHSNGMLLGASIAAFVATFTFGNGALLWPVGLVQLLMQAFGSTARSQYRLPIAAWAVTSSVICGGLFLTYSGPPKLNPTGISYILHHPWNALQFFFECIAVPLADDAPSALACGMFLFVLTIAALARLYRLKTLVLEQAAPFVSMILWSGVSAALITATRLGPGFQGALSSRYGSITMLGIIGLYGLVTYILWTSPPDRLITGALLGIVSLGVVSTQIHGFETVQPVMQYRLEGAAVLPIFEYGSEEYLSRIYPDPARIREWAPFLRSYGYSSFKYPLPLLPDHNLGNSDWCAIAPVNGRIGDRVVVNTANEKTITIEGWALDKQNRAAAAGAFLDVDDSLHVPISLDVTRDDVANAFGGNQYRRSGFRLSLRTSALQVGIHTLSLRIGNPVGDSYWRCAGAGSIKVVEVR